MNFDRGFTRAQGVQISPILTLLAQINEKIAAGA